MRAVSILVTLLGATLLFLVQPLVARLALPFLGGAPAVWSGCLVFFQALLLLGYLYAHLVASRLGSRTGAIVHLALLGASSACLPLRWDGGPAGGVAPIPWLLVRLAATIGLPFFLLSATGPLVQAWLHAARGSGLRDPYRLYALSNAGSLVGLASYPLLLEPLLPLRAGPVSQSGLWSAGYAVYLLLMAICVVLQLRRPCAASPREIRRVAGTAASRSERLRWVVLAAVPASALLAVTQYISTDLAVFPLLWVVPLGVYLVSFVLAFSGPRPALLSTSSTGLAVCAVAAAASLWAFERPYTWALLVLQPLLLFFLALVCHGRLAITRPPPERLGEFYLCVALGGVLGGAFNTLLAPRLFVSIAEYPLVILAACLLRPGAPAGSAARPGGRARALDILLPALLVLLVPVARVAPALLGIEAALGALVLQVGLPCALALLWLRRPLRFALALGVLLGAAWISARPSGELLHARRSFFGVHRVLLRSGPALQGVDASGARSAVSVPFHVVYHGSTRHGSQALTPRLRGEPTSYYHRSGPLGELFEALGGGERTERIAVVGLGAGALAAYAREGSRITFFELDPEVVAIARDARLFSYLEDARGVVEVVEGDGRIGLAQAPDAEYGLIVLDAFSSDAVPVHLLTREAIEIYFRKLRRDGVLAVHVTNQHLDLEAVLHAIAARLGLVGASKSDEVTSLQQMLEGKDRSQWVVLARESAALGPLASDPEWLRVPVAGAASDPRVLWTDDFSSVLRVLRSY